MTSINIRVNIIKKYIFTIFSYSAFNVLLVRTYNAVVPKVMHVFAGSLFIYNNNSSGVIADRYKMLFVRNKVPLKCFPPTETNTSKTLF